MPNGKLPSLLSHLIQRRQFHFTTAHGKRCKTQRPLPPTRNGFVFDDWYTDEALTHVYDFNTLVTQNITLYAKWIEAENITRELLQNLIDEARAISQNNYTRRFFMI